MSKMFKTAAVIIAALLVFTIISCENNASTSEPTVYTVTFDSDGGSNVESQNVQEGNTARKPDAPAKIGYMFEGWYYGNTAFNFAEKITENKTLKAKWRLIEYTITYIGIEDAVNSNPTSYTIESDDIVLQDAVKSNCSFYYWECKTEFRGIGTIGSSHVSYKYPNGDRITKIAKGSYGDITLKAWWSYPPNGNYTEGEIISFGSFPQSKKADEITVDRNDYKDTGYFRYYKGSDGEWYVYSGEYYKVEPIKWKVITTNYNGSGKTLLLAENIISFCPYYADYTRTIDSITIYNNNYKHSEIRAYLNGLSYITKASENDEQKISDNWLNKGFLQTAFNEEEQAKIAVTDVDNSSKSYACEDTLDKLFLLSNLELEDPEYGFACKIFDDTQIREYTDFANTEYLAIFWWLRTPDNEDDKKSYAVLQNFYKEWESSAKLGVVPALCLD